jgi:hypothetical protein
VSAAERIFALSPQGWTSHPLHGHERDFRETNCYVDVWIELLHALGLEPLACLGFTLASDFEGDQWTFFKPPHGDLERLYEVRVEELTLWRPLLEHARAQTARGRLPLVEVDSFFLPDTHATDYRKRHTKTTIAISQVDVEARRLCYFHNTGLQSLEGDDFDGVFAPGPSERPDYLPPYCEIVKPERARAARPAELRATSAELARHHLTRRPRANPLLAHKAQLAADVALIASGGMPTYHGYCFASLRQLGASMELLAAYLRWLDGETPAACTEAAASFAAISSTAKGLILRLARVAASGRPTDPSASFELMASAWQRGMDLVLGALGA